MWFIIYQVNNNNVTFCVELHPLATYFRFSLGLHVHTPCTHSRFMVCDPQLRFILMFKCLNNMAPSYLSDSLTYLSNHQSYTTRYVI